MTKKILKERETESRLQINSSMPYPNTCPKESDLIKAKNGICQTQMDLNIYLIERFSKHTFILCWFLSLIVG